ncbi:cytochrome d ubiquinol oxidase subunit II [Candidatus Aerophobetes bacterium]|uniref:Cytochrome d ubiquinol oxidase subunit II n=1 Tax=Aerophobetes bacterium TaxID=2030807 RepID=A0A2A4X7W8_UNCAE|nr:MAG: cytochrome d ubiquinol oxidase subunit II [Candidatus Aerophobetes bacterium]
MALFWYGIIGVSLVAYAILDGFDLGVGCLHLLGKTDLDRRIFLNAIGPVWDGNEVWLIIIFGGLFAGFPAVYATLCSVFYSLIMAMIAGIIFRAVSIEFRSKRESKKWRSFWDIAFSVSSVFMSFIMGVIVGNVVEGVPIDALGVYNSTFLDFFTPYPILVGITSIFLFSMHGAVFLLMKTEGELHRDLRKYVMVCIALFMICYVGLTLYTIAYRPFMTQMIVRYPAVGLIGVFAFLAILNIGRCIKKGYDGWAFISSSISILLLIALFASGTYPVMIRSTLDASYSLTYQSSSASPVTLKILMIVVIIGIPLVLAYGAWIYRIFRGKVVLDEGSY